MGADGRQQQVPGGRLHNGASGGHGIAGGAGGGGDDDAVAAYLGQAALLREDVQPHHPGDGALGHHCVVQGDVVIHLPPLPQHRHVQHHPGFHGEAALGQVPQPVQLVDLQLRHEAKASQVHPQHRHAVQRHGTGQVQDGAVAAEGDQQVRLADLLL